MNIIPKLSNTEHLIPLITTRKANPSISGLKGHSKLHKNTFSSQSQSGFPSLRSLLQVSLLKLIYTTQLENSSIWCISVGEGWRQETQNASVQVVIKTRTKETQKNGDAKTRLHCLRVGHISLRGSACGTLPPFSGKSRLCFGVRPGRGPAKGSRR